MSSGFRFVRAKPWADRQLVQTFEGFEMRLPSIPASAQAAREWVRLHLEAWNLHGLIGDAELLVSELVTNVVRHVHEPMVLCFSRRGNTVRMDVGDPSPAEPVVRLPDPDREGGRGVPLIASVAARWGTVTHPGDGKTVWFELDQHPQPDST